jgi:pimeloyl-ACP methyl ester carboxylesterase
VALLDALGIERAHLVGNSLGGRVALEVGLREPDRVARLGLLAPSMAWRRERRWAPALRLLRPELGLLQIAPERAVDPIVRRLIPAGATAGRPRASTSSCARTRPRAGAPRSTPPRARSTSRSPRATTASGRGCARSSPTRCSSGGATTSSSPIAFARHVSDAVPGARHEELDCGHVPQLERPRETHAALAGFLAS